MVVEIRFIQMLHYCMVDKELTMMVIDRVTSMYCISTVQGVLKRPAG